jgi:hypothetical protein
MKPNRDNYEDDPEGYEQAWSRYEERMEDLRDWKRDEEAENDTEK